MLDRGNYTTKLRPFSSLLLGVVKKIKSFLRIVIWNKLHLRQQWHWHCHHETWGCSSVNWILLISKHCAMMIFAFVNLIKKISYWLISFGNLNAINHVLNFRNFPYHYHWRISIVYSLVTIIDVHINTFTWIILKLGCWHVKHVHYWNTYISQSIKDFKLIYVCVDILSEYTRDRTLKLPSKCTFD